MNDMDSTTEPKDVGVAKRTWKGHSLGFWLLEAISAFARFYMAYIWISAVYHRCRVRLGAWADDRLRLLHCRYQRIGSGYELFTHNPAGCVLYLLKRVDCAQAFPTLSYLSVGGRLSLTETFSLARTNEEQGG